MFRRFMTNRWGYRSAWPRRRGGFLAYSYSATVILVSLGALLILYLLGYIAV